MAESSPLYRLEVVPLTPLFGKRDPRFSYVSTEPVAIGSLASISFGKRNLTGVILGSLPLPGPKPDWMKPIGTIILPAFLIDHQIRLAWELSEQLYTPLGLVFKLFFPLQRKPRAVQVNSTDTPSGKKSPKKKALARRKSTRTAKVVWEGMTDDTALFCQLIALSQKSLKAKKLLLILVPELLAAELYATKLRALFTEANIGCLSSRRTPRETYLLHQALKEESVDILIGTRQAVFAPLSNLAEIVIIDPEKRLSYVQWEMAPRYDAVIVALSIAQAQNVSCRKLSVAPGAEFFLPDTATVRTGTPFHFDTQRRLKTIDLRKGYKKNTKERILSPELIDAIRQTEKDKRPVLILARQRGVSRFSLCAKCQTVLRCPNCSAPLSEMKNGSYRCLTDGYRSPLFPSCRECGQMQFKSFGAGTESIARALTEAGLSSKPIILDRDSQGLKQDFEKLISTLTETPTPSIIIATYEAATSLPLGQLGLIACIEADQGLFFPDFQSEERLWREIRCFGGKLGDGGTLIVQTFEPDSKFWTAWIRQELEATAAELLEERKLLHYPPYFSFIRLECWSTKGESSLQVAEKTEQQLKDIAPKEIEILPRYLPFNRKNRYHILIRFPAETEPPKALITALHSLDQSVKIMHNPVSLQG